MPRKRKWGAALDKPAEYRAKMPGAGLRDDVLRVSLETRDRKLGEQRIAMFQDLYGRRLFALLRARVDEQFTTAELHQAYRTGEAELTALLQRAAGKRLAPLVADFRKQYTKRGRANVFTHVTRFLADHGGDAATTAALTPAGIATWLADLTSHQGRRARRAPAATPAAGGGTAPAIRPRTGTCACGATFTVTAPGPMPRACPAHQAKRRRAPARPASGATKNRARAAIGSLCTWLLRQGHLTTHPIRGQQVTKYEEAEGRMPAPFTPDDTRDYLAAVRREAPELAAAFTLLVFTGADLGEVLSREAHHVELGRTPARVLYKRTKTRTPTRAVPLDPESANEVRAHLAATGARGEQRLWPDVTPEGLWRVHKVARAAIGRPSLTIKDLRHIAAIAWTKAGVNMVRIKDYLGHATLSQTARYAHYAPDQAEEAEVARRVARELRGAAGVTPITAARAAKEATA